MFDEGTYSKYIPEDVPKESKCADGLAFGKSVCDFTYPESSVFIAEEGLTGCSVSIIKRGDTACVSHRNCPPSRRIFLFGTTLICMGQCTESDLIPKIVLFRYVND